MEPLSYGFRNGLALAVRCQQGQRLEIEFAGDLLHALQRQVALASLNASHVGAVHAEYVGKVLLTEITSFAVRPQVLANNALQLTFHEGGRCRVATCKSTDR